ncbi:unnamed protein product [Angiostrongylus costaricensis]|uniref:Histone H1 n=1 Tax=Angiostrongylus costaricensis TaxID=334426 RepID=A0A0R3Q271_ANGCS|nr:unnamed protein product [Angiostrongylus costaricensis]
MSAHAAGSSREAAKTPKRKTAEETRSQSSHLAMIRSLMDELRQKFRSLEVAILRFILSRYSLEDIVAMISSLLRFPPGEAVMEPELKQVEGNEASGSYGLGEKMSTLVAKKHVVGKLASRKHNSTKAAAKKPKAEKKVRNLKEVKAPKSETTEKFKSKATKSRARKPRGLFSGPWFLVFQELSLSHDLTE